jgi:cation transport protein ChaC
MVTRVYTPRWVTVRLGDRMVRAHTYTAAHNHVQYAGKLTPERAAECIRNNSGRSGDNVDYLLNAVIHLDALGIADGPLHRLKDLVTRA